MSVVDLLAARGRGPIWGDVTDDLNLTLLSWPAGEGPTEHVNDERDVVIVVIVGEGTLLLDGVEHGLRVGHAVVVPMGVSRAITAGPNGLRYLSIHRRRGGLQNRPHRPFERGQTQPDE
jgi:quercetin dioxygenase-like cupin family protein